MANKWGIPSHVEKLVLERDRKCVYCQIQFDHTAPKRKPSWEHIINDININHSDNIALCCISCNSSKGSKDLKTWLKTEYCKNKNITASTVAEVIKQALSK